MALYNVGQLLQACSRSLVICLIVAVGSACENRSADTTPVANPPAPAPSRLLRLTAEELSRMQLELSPVAQGEILSHREFPATVQANQNELAEVTALIRGRVVKVHVDVGQDVKKGTLLALLHSVDLGVAEGEHLKAEARLEEAERSHGRARELYENKAVSLAELQRREAAMKAARAESRETRNRLELLGVPREEIDRLDREHTIKADMPLRAPFDGRVITRNITKGEVVETDQTLFTVANLTDVWVIGNVPEKDIRFIRKDQTVNVVLAAYPHAIFSGTITYVGDMLDPATRTMSLRVTVPNPDRLLKPEMFAIISVYITSSPDALSIPLAAVHDGPAGKMVFVQREAGVFETRTVKLGNEEGDGVRVFEGVQAGEQVVTKGSFALKSEIERHKIEPTP
ncbi:MAG: efflux RND transporter periplasmic adaptor subunit [Nitrospira sp.]|nr:efflux RND transporter periplasmic adaptor subunit [Nitrospira sp.]MDH4303772.1 efflux RND transporter periplasmic adaptor subunit [Nitrospira sp.]MDH5193039.1 efflux RND transporter periplasmic adaptor subunit [Nitrospira sp.]